MNGEHTVQFAVVATMQQWLDVYYLTKQILGTPSLLAGT